MSDADPYALLDFGGGRKLERFGTVVLDRPAPAAENDKRSDPETWRRADARYERTSGETGRWTHQGRLPESWTVRFREIGFRLKLTDSGQVGLFPEQALNWAWLKERVSRFPKPMRVLNLFAYTGGSTLAAAVGGAEVTHVDSARTVVAWARRNAEFSDLASAPIRWITEDALKFVRREVKRGRQYDAVVLDPPSYGHGPKGEAWKLAEHLPVLLELCASLTRERPAFLLLTCHTPGFGTEELRRALTIAAGNGDIETMPLAIRSTDGRKLDCGDCARWSASSGSA